MPAWGTSYTGGANFEWGLGSVGVGVRFRFGVEVRVILLFGAVRPHFRAILGRFFQIWVSFWARFRQNFLPNCKPNPFLDPY